MVIILVFSISLYVVFSTKNRIFESTDNLKDIDAILVLGAGIRNDKPSPMLEDRLLKSIELYEKGLTSKLIMSGDHIKEDYDEVNIMKKYAIDKGVKSSDIFMDHAGISTYDSIYRAKEIFGVKKMVIVTQEYHLYRALYIAKSLGIEAYGVSAEKIDYGGQKFRDMREVLARDKDFVKCICKPKSKYLGETILVSGDGDITNDK